MSKLYFLDLMLNIRSFLFWVNVICISIFLFHIFFCEINMIAGAHLLKVILILSIILCVTPREETIKDMKQIILRDYKLKDEERNLKCYVEHVKSLQEYHKGN